MVTCLHLGSESETERLAEVLAERLSAGGSVGLCGDLGAGKTTFVRYLVTALGGAATGVSSPSFTLENEYALPSGQMVEHWDLYRLNTLPVELLEPPGKGVLRIVEWPDRIQGFAESLDLVVSFRVVDGGVREVSFSGVQALSLNEVSSTDTWLSK